MRHLLLLSAVILPPLTACTPSHCEVDGVQHRVGETYTCADGCNICECGVNGVSSTLMFCATDTGGLDDSADTGSTGAGTGSSGEGTVGATGSSGDVVPTSTGVPTTGDGTDAGTDGSTGGGFMCSNGETVPVEFVCNESIDCTDYSDEVTGCGIPAYVCKDGQKIKPERLKKCL